MPALLLMLLILSAAAGGSTIDPEDNVILFPGYAFRTESGDGWLARIHGWAYDPERRSPARKAMLALLRSAADVEKHKGSEELFNERARYFLVDSADGETVTLRVGDQAFDSSPTGEDGHFRDAVKISDERIAQLTAAGEVRDRWLRYCTQVGSSTGRESTTNPLRTISGGIELIEPQGISIISDIDDTIRVTQVGDRKKLFANTFLRPYEPVPDMPELYRDWQGQGAVFHYVSESPWQLYEPLRQFFDGAGLPRGTLHLRRVRLRPGSLLHLLEGVGRKDAAIKQIFQDFPHRWFVLVGDTGERDPEVYGEIARQFPDQVATIYLRNVTGEITDSDRFREAFHDVPRDRWRLFYKPKDLPRALPPVTTAPATAGAPTP